jgi:UDP-N-acetylmuramate dehydrogenase
MNDFAIRENVDLAPLTTLGVGGKARFFVDVKDEAGLQSALQWAARDNVAVTVLGGGSNVLVSDRGFDGLVLRIRIAGIEQLSSDRSDRIELRVGAGEELDLFVDRAVREGWAGVECLSGIPGYVGATPIQNVGAYGQEISETVVSVRAMDRRTGEVSEIDNPSCRFAYRSSAFKEELRGRHVVLSVHLSLVRGGAATVRYPELVREIAARGGDRSSLSMVRDTVLALRRSKSMVIDPTDPNRRSAGSFFMNPIVSTQKADEVEERARAAGSASMPRFAAGSSVKLSAGWLIERAGFGKGTIDGRVGLSTRHALAIVNRGGATATELLTFAARVRNGVRDRFGVALEHEPVLVGFNDEEARILEG